jgi:hypothetical protein
MGRPAADRRTARGRDGHTATGGCDPFADSPTRPLAVSPAVLARDLPSRGSTCQFRKEPHMPRGVKEGSKRGRQYEHVKESYQKRGDSKDKAEERAARTVNKQRRQSGETKKK